MNPSKETHNVVIPGNGEFDTTHLTITDHAENPLEAGQYLTGYRAEGEDWTMTVDYFENVRLWAVYATMGTDTTPLTPEILAHFLTVHEDAQGIADYLNGHALTAKLNAAAEARDELQALTRNGLIVTIP